MGFKVFLAMYTKMTLKTTYTPLTQSHKLNGTLQKRTTNRSMVWTASKIRSTTTLQTTTSTTTTTTQTTAGVLDDHLLAKTKHNIDNYNDKNYNSNTNKTTSK